MSSVVEILLDDNSATEHELEFLLLIESASSVFCQAYVIGTFVYSVYNDRSAELSSFWIFLSLLSRWIFSKFELPFLKLLVHQFADEILEFGNYLIKKMLMKILLKQSGQHETQKSFNLLQLIY